MKRGSENVEDRTIIVASSSAQALAISRDICRSRWEVLTGDYGSVG